MISVVECLLLELSMMGLRGCQNVVVVCLKLVSSAAAVIAVARVISYLDLVAEPLEKVKN